MATQSLALTSELSSQVLEKMNPFELIEQRNPAKESTETLIRVNQMIGTSFKDYFLKVTPWILELKNNRFKVRPGSKGVQLDVNLPNVGLVKMYWHEFFDRTFKVTKRHFQQLEKQVEEGIWQEPSLREDALEDQAAGCRPRPREPTGAHHAIR